jgi:hypothetical protein
MDANITLHSYREEMKLGFQECTEKLQIPFHQFAGE